MTQKEHRYFVAWALAMSIALAYVVMQVAPTSHPSGQWVLTGPYAQSRLPNTYRFFPKEDITPYELALSVSAMMGSVDFLDRMKPFYESMPPSVRRHWLDLSPAAPPPAHEHEHQ